MINVLKEMLLIEDPSIVRLYQEMMKITNYFVAPVFTISLILEYFSGMNFAEPVKKLFLIVIFMGAFYSFHTEATQIALESATQTLRRVSPTNLFVKRWSQSKIKTKNQKGWDSFKNFFIPNLNDFLGTAFFVLAKIFIWLLKLIYSSVYHLTYVFAGFTAILYFLGWTKDALKGTVQASLWCIAMPFVIVAILSLVGNSIEASALNGDLVIANIETVIWLFGVTLLLLISPLITYGMIRGEGIHSFGSKMGAMVVNSGIKALTFYPMMAKMMKSASSGLIQTGKKSLFEPSIKDLLNKENSPDKKKMKLLESKGNMKSPFKPSRSLDERLKSVGMTKDEVMKLNRNASNVSRRNSGKNLVKNFANKEELRKTNDIANSSRNRLNKQPSPKKTSPNGEKSNGNYSLMDRSLTTKQLVKLSRNNPTEFKEKLKIRKAEKQEERKERMRLRRKKYEL